MTELDELIARFDVTDPAFVQWPYPVLDELREATPIFFDERTDQWVLTRFAEVHETLRDRRLGRAYTHRYTHEQFGRPEPDARWRRFHEHEQWSLLAIEPPDHTRLRRLITKVFTPRAVEAMRPQVEALADELVAGCAERGRFDLIADYAQPYSVAVICSMLGVPRADTRRLLDWSHAIVKMYELRTGDDVKVAADRAAGEFIDYTRALIADKRRSPDGSLISGLVAVEDEGEQLSEAEITSTAMVLLEAGHEATVNSLANGMKAMLTHRDEWRRVTSGEVAPRTAIEDMIRWDAPLHLFERWVLDEGVEIAGQPIPVGAEVAMLFGAANRDPRRFDDPGRFDAGRGDTAHVGFGGGIHFCIGAPLARLELEVSVDRLARLMPHVELAADPVYHPTFVIRGLTALELSI
ncbi:MAG: cytochrome P450 [Acidimicrobiales bacterium]